MIYSKNLNRVRFVHLLKIQELISVFGADGCWTLMWGERKLEKIGENRKNLHQDWHQLAIPPDMFGRYHIWVLGVWIPLYRGLKT